MTSTSYRSCEVVSNVSKKKKKENECGTGCSNICEYLLHNAAGTVHKLFKVQ